MLKKEENLNLIEATKLALQGKLEEAEGYNGKEFKIEHGISCPIIKQVKEIPENIGDIVDTLTQFYNDLVSLMSKNEIIERGTPIEKYIIGPRKVLAQSGCLNCKYIYYDYKSGIWGMNDVSIYTFNKSIEDTINGLDKEARVDYYNSIVSVLDIKSCASKSWHPSLINITGNSVQEVLSKFENTKQVLDQIAQKGDVSDFQQDIDNRNAEIQKAQDEKNAKKKERYNQAVQTIKDKYGLDWEDYNNILEMYLEDRDYNDREGAYDNLVSAVCNEFGLGWDESEQLAKLIKKLA